MKKYRVVVTTEAQHDIRSLSQREKTKPTSGAEYLG